MSGMRRSANIVLDFSGVCVCVGGCMKFFLFKYHSPCKTQMNTDKDRLRFSFSRFEMLLRKYYGVFSLCFLHSLKFIVGLTDRPTFKAREFNLSYYLTRSWREIRFKLFQRALMRSKHCKLGILKSIQFGPEFELCSLSCFPCRDQLHIRGMIVTNGGPD